jgi:putative holliday junction resolvase
LREAHRSRAEGVRVRRAAALGAAVSCTLSGIWIGVDVGTVRVGVARSDPNGILATPLATLARDAVGGTDLAELAQLVREHQAVGVVVGLPVTLAGHEGPSAAMARDYANALSSRISPVPVELVDERLTTATAQRRLAQRGIRGKARRAVVDQAAAVEILQHWLHARS